jgi:hypothetical protein
MFSSVGVVRESDFLNPDTTNSSMTRQHEHRHANETTNVTDSTHPRTTLAGATLDPAPVATGTVSVSSEAQLTNLSDLKKLSKEDFHQVFVNNMNIIFQYTMQDIEKVLEGVALETLTPLHKTLCNMAKDMFPKFANMRAKNRIITNTAITDIRNLGFSLVNKSPLRDLDKTFVEVEQPSTKNPELDDNTSSNQKLLETILLVQDRVTSLECKVATLEDENTKLRYVITQLQDSVEGNNSVSTVDIPAPTTTSDTSDVRTTTAGSNPDTPLIVSDVSSSDESSDSDAGSSNFQYQSRYRKKLTKLNKKQKKQNTISSATSAHPSVGGIRSARGNTNTGITDMYIGGVHSSHSASDITEHIQSMGIVIRHPVQVLSRKDSWCSFRVGVSAVDVSTISCTDNWQPGIRVRPFCAQRQPGDATSQVHTKTNTRYDNRQHRGNYRQTQYNDRHHTKPRYPPTSAHNRERQYDAETYQGEQWRNSARPTWREASRNSYSHKYY